MTTQKYQRGRLRVRTGGIDDWQDVYPVDIHVRPPKGDLVCCGCSAWMGWVMAFNNKNETEVPAYFRLWKNHNHAFGCTLTLESLGRDLHRDAPDTIEIEEKIIYLLLPDEATIKKIQPTTTGGTHNGGPSWVSTLTSTTRIAQFLRQFDDAGDYLNRLKIRYRDKGGNIKEMFWSEFCFDACARWSRIYLTKLLDAEHQSDIPPVAVSFTLRQHPKPNSQRTVKMVRLDTGHILNDDRKLFMSVVVDISSNLLDEFRPGDTILALAHGETFDWKTRGVKEIKLTINHPWQLTHLRS